MTLVTESAVFMGCPVKMGVQQKVFHSIRLEIHITIYMAFLKPFLQQKLYYFLISSEIQPLMSAVLIKQSVATDHSSIISQLNSTQKLLHGPSD